MLIMSLFDRSAGNQSRVGRNQLRLHITHWQDKGILRPNGERSRPISRLESLILSDHYRPLQLLNGSIRFSVILYLPV